MESKMRKDHEFNWQNQVTTRRAEERHYAQHLIRGCCSELYACAWLMEQGWEVFRNVSAKGWVDICAFKAGGYPIPIDVKTVRYNPETDVLSCQKLKDWQEQAGVLPLYVTEDGICSFTYSDIVAVYRGAEAASKIKPQRYAQATEEARKRLGLTSL